jgi:quercetin dioxygenase-like cupin family protein
MIKTNSRGKTMKMKQKILAVTLCTIGLAGAALVAAQSTGLKRTVIGKGELSVENREAVIVRVDLDAGAVAGKHTHPGEEIAYIMEGEAELLIDGEPPRKVKAGDAFVIPAGKAHDAKNTGSVPLKLVGVYVVEKGKPLATAAK